MLLAMARDVRVILIKLADRLHNMRTLDAVAPAKRRRIARETLEIYAPIANRLGLDGLYHELEELGFQHLHPMRYRVLAKAVKGARGNRREVVDKILDAIKQRLRRSPARGDVTGREKHIYSIYKKMLEKKLSFSEVLDIYGFRVIVNDVPACYLALGALHALYKPIPGKFKDYIAIPKPNGYQSLHTTLFGPFGMPIEVQIRTRDMHKIAEAGVASHWLYKDEETRHAVGGAEQHAQVAAVADRDPVRERRLGRVPRAREGRPLPRRGLRLHAQGQDHGAAARRDRRRLRLRGAHRHRQPLRRGQDQRRAGAAAHRAARTATASRSSPRRTRSPIRRGSTTS